MTKLEKKEEERKLKKAWADVCKREKRYKFLLEQITKQKEEIEEALRNL